MRFWWLDYEACLFRLLEPLEAQHIWFHMHNNLIINTVRSYLPYGQVRIFEVGCGIGTVLTRFVAERE